jgi:hypothetical protein
VLLGFVSVASQTALAAPARVQPTTQLGGIPEAGAPSFVFNQGFNSFSTNVQSWFDNYVIIQNEGGADGSYNLFAHNEGEFTYWENMGSSMGGTRGSFDLNAKFDSNGVLQAGGTVQITGAIAGAGINDPATVLMTADLVGFEYDNALVGFAIANIRCAEEIVGCADDPDQVESIYFGMTAGFVGMENLNGSNYRTTMTNITTVPVPAALWLMVSGLACLGSLMRRKTTTA